jgi:hypothetical protein
MFRTEGITMGRHTLIEDPVPHPPERPDPLVTTGTHRAVGKAVPRRRVATWPIACAVLIALIVLGVFGWNWADSVLSNRAEAQAASCPEGNSTLRVLVAPNIEKAVARSANSWNQAKTIVYAHCIQVDVRPAQSAEVLDALLGKTSLDTIGGLPAAWVPESSYWIGQLETVKPEMIGSPAQSVASASSADYPYLGLAGNGVDDTQMRAAQVFREFLKQPAQQKDFTDAGIKVT